MSTLRNRVMLIGHLGQAPEVKELGGDKKVARFSIATNDNYTNEKGEKMTDTQWHNAVAWGKLADIAEKFLDKGKEIAIEGKLVTRNYTDKENVKRYVTEVVVNEILMISGKKE
ncbi:MAG TPA: single-stranded DNA-binding protein [Bacteroidia bacterium]